MNCTLNVFAQAKVKGKNGNISIDNVNLQDLTDVLVLATGATESKLNVQINNVQISGLNEPKFVRHRVSNVAIYAEITECINTHGFYSNYAFDDVIIDGLYYPSPKKSVR